MSRIPREAREGLMRVWLKVLQDKHPTVTWVPVSAAEVPVPPETTATPYTD